VTFVRARDGTRLAIVTAGSSLASAWGSVAMSNERATTDDDTDEEEEAEAEPDDDREHDRAWDTEAPEREEQRDQENIDLDIECVNEALERKARRQTR
jgi:hypothetical protein